MLSVSKPVDCAQEGSDMVVTTILAIAVEEERGGGEAAVI